MKTDAPEKIYLIRNFPRSTSLNTTNDYRGKFLPDWYKTREKDADIEYTRTDTFIEKACDAYCKVCKIPNCRRNECKFIGEFKSHLEII